MIERNDYLKMLIERKRNGMVKVITGLRRCGKSYLLFEIYRKYLLSSGVKEDEIVALALDDDENAMCRNPLRLGEYLREMVSDVISSSVGSLTNPSKIADTFKSVKKQNITDDTVAKYLDYFTDAFLIAKAKRYDIKGRKYIGSPLKYYYTDVGLRNVRLNFRQTEENHIMENIIYNELVRRGLSVDSQSNLNVKSKIETLLSKRPEQRGCFMEYLSISLSGEQLERIFSGKKTLIFSRMLPVYFAPFLLLLYTSVEGADLKEASPVGLCLCEKVVRFPYEDLSYPDARYDGDPTVVDCGYGYYISYAEEVKSCLSYEEICKLGAGETLYALYIKESVRFHHEQAS